MESSFGELFWRAHEFIWFYLSKHKIQLNFQDFFCQKANLIWKNMINNLLILIRLISFVKTQVQIILLNFHVKAKIQINLLDFSCLNPDANVLMWFYLSKHKIPPNFLDFSCQKANLIWKNMISNLLILIRLISLVKTKIQINLFEFSCQSKNSNQFAGFSCQNTHGNKFIWFYLSKHKNQLNFLDFSCQKANLIRKIDK
mgnify:FL=1